MLKMISLNAVKLLLYDVQQHVIKERLLLLNLVTSISSYLSACIVKHNGVPLPALNSNQISNLIRLSEH